MCHSGGSQEPDLDLALVAEKQGKSVGAQFGENEGVGGGA